MMEGGEGGRPACRSVDYECVWEGGREGKGGMEEGQSRRERGTGGGSLPLLNHRRSYRKMRF